VAFGSFSDGRHIAPASEINIIPLVDVMLVLLVIFIITAPLLTHAVKIDLPKASSAPNLTRPDNIPRAVRADGTTFWNGEVVARDSLDARLAEASRTQPQPELHLRADRTTAYEHVAEVMAAASRAGILKLGFVSEPSH
jgi:biopolymer transport protein ExbD